MGPRFESVKVHQWPVGQVVKTAASHAANGSSTLPRVTKLLTRVRKCAIMHKLLEPTGFDINEGETLPYELVLIAMRVHLFPYRTQKLSSFAPTILGG